MPTTLEDLREIVADFTESGALRQQLFEADASEVHILKQLLIHYPSPFEIRHRLLHSRMHTGFIDIFALNPF